MTIIVNISGASENNTLDVYDPLSINSIQIQTQQFITSTLPGASACTIFLRDQLLTRLNNFLTLENQLLFIQLIFFVGVCFNYRKIRQFFRGIRQDVSANSAKSMIAYVTTSAAAFSMIVTSTTPLSRLLYKKWLGTHGFTHLQDAAGVTKLEDGYYDYRVKQGSVVDYSFALHATFGLLWVISGCMAIRSGANNEIKHRSRWGYIALVSYACHTTFALAILYINHAQHLAMNRLMLLMSLLESTYHMAAAFKALKSNNEKKVRRDNHMKHMFLSYVYSTEGAGQIRFVFILNKLLGRNVHEFCVDKAYHFNSECAWPYVERLCLIRFTSKLIIALYCYRNQEDHDMWRYVKKGLKMNVVVVLMVWTFQYFDATWLMGCISFFFVLDYVHGFHCIIKYGVNTDKPLAIPSILYFNTN